MKILGSVLFECLLALSLFQFTLLLTWTSLGVLHRHVTRLEEQAVKQQLLITSLIQWVYTNTHCPGRENHQICEVCLPMSNTKKDIRCLRAQSRVQPVIPSWS